MKRKVFGLRHPAVAYVLAALIGVAALLHITVTIGAHVAPDSWFTQHGALFDLDNEWNVPSVYTGLLWGATAFMCMLLTLRQQPRIQRIRWIFISTLFLYFGFDEILVIHEHLAAPVRHALHIADGSPLYHAWIIPAVAVTVVIGMLYATVKTKTPMSREQKTMLGLLVVLAIGDVALEAIGTQLYFSQLFYKLGPVMVEELFEMAMISTLLYHATSYVLDHPEK